jgi:putative ABC transport system substrate-binding protein
VDLMASALRAASGLTLAMVTSWSLAQPAALPRIGWVISGTPENTRHIVQAIHAGLGDEGLVDGRDVVLDVRFTGGRPERYPELFGELTRQPVAVLAGASHAGISAARDASAGRTPVSAFFCGNDAKAMVESFARPGGNITGVSCFATELATKRVELLKRAVPTLRRIGLLYDSSNPGKEQEFIQVQQAADQLGMSATRAAASSVQDLREAIGSLRRDGAEALIISEDAFTFGNRAAIVALAAEHRLVDISPFREFVQAGGVLSYGANIAERLRAQARYAAKLVRGTKPSELPIDQAMRLELVVNQKAARALGTQIPAAVLARADEVLE